MAHGRTGPSSTGGFGSSSLLTALVQGRHGNGTRRLNYKHGVRLLFKTWGVPVTPKNRGGKIHPKKGVKKTDMG